MSTKAGVLSHTSPVCSSKVRSPNNSESAATAAAAAAAAAQGPVEARHTTPQHAASKYLTCLSDAESQGKHKSSLVQLLRKVIMISLQPGLLRFRLVPAALPEEPCANRLHR